MLSGKAILLSCTFLLPIYQQGPLLKVVDSDQLKQRVQIPSSDTLYVVNFWATWCKPCVQELPWFEKASETFHNQKVKVILVSLDSPEEGTKVEKFAAARGLKNELYLLNGGNPNVWINAIDSSWTGAIPATVYYRKGVKLAFHEGDYEQTPLDSTINKLIQ